MRFIDFFAGIGGFRLGMEMAGHKCVGHCEINKYADKSYRAMHEVKEDEWYADDITRVESRDLPEAECFCFGFPCQSFSCAGKRGGFQDVRGTLFFEVMRLAKERNPKYLFAENVKGLLNHDGGATFETIIRTMDELGYSAEWQMLNSRDFGVPQNRERIFIIGHLGRISGEQIFPIGKRCSEVERLHRNKNVQVWGGLGEKKSNNNTQWYQQDRVYNPDGISPALARNKSDLKIITNCITTRTGAKTGGGYPITRKGENIGLMKVNNYQSSKKKVKPIINPKRKEVRQEGRRVKEDGEESFTLTAQDRQGVVIEEDDEIQIRQLTPKECFRLQGFPDEYFERANAVNKDSELYKQAGNSVTVPVIYEIAKRLKEIE